MKMKILLSLLVVIGLLMILSACAPSSTPAASDTTSNTSLDGKALVETRCSVCHGIDRVTSKTKTETEWTATVERMIGHGAVLSDAEKAAVIAYLAATYK